MAEPPRPPERPIVLVGLMGAGKTTVGRRLAKRLGLAFFDSDAEIERIAGLSVAAIFERFGEAHFREIERQAIGRLIEGQPSVVATGGGAFADAGTRAIVLARCTAIWLDAGLETLTERVSRRGHRPLLNGRDARETLAALAGARNPIYAQAHMTVDAERPHDEVVARILVALERAP